MDDQLCERCGHDFGDHLMIRSDEPEGGGVFICPVEDCECVVRWVP